jgi:hypothetical protein
MYLVRVECCSLSTVSDLETQPRSFPQKEEDIAFEEEVVRNPFALKTWWHYLLAKKEAEAPARDLNLVYERALKRVRSVVRASGVVLWCV